MHLTGSGTFRLYYGSVALQMQSATAMPMFIFTDVINVVINNVQDVFLLDSTSSPRETTSKDLINL